MYFDDCERRGVEEWEAALAATWTSPTPWIISRSEEKQLAMERLLGYNPESASALSREQVEDETLQWAVDTHVLGFHHEEDSNEQAVYKYDTISDLMVASECPGVGRM